MGKEFTKTRSLGKVKKRLTFSKETLVEHIVPQEY